MKKTTLIISLLLSGFAASAVAETATSRGAKGGHVQHQSPLVPGGANPPIKILSLANEDISQRHLQTSGAVPGAALIKALQVENAKLREDAARWSRDLKAVQGALASAESRAKAAENELRELKLASVANTGAHLGQSVRESGSSQAGKEGTVALRGQTKGVDRDETGSPLSSGMRGEYPVVASNDSPGIAGSRQRDYVRLLESFGEAVFLNGVGEVKIAISGDQTIIRVSRDATVRADSMLVSKGAHKQSRGKYVYYTIDSELLARQGG